MDYIHLYIGNFEVTLCADSYNHFISKDFPSHSHWHIQYTMNSCNNIVINFGRYGIYDMILSYDTNCNNYVMNGCKRDQPKNWRQCVLRCSLGAEGLLLVGDSGHDHCHSHSHEHH